MLKKYLPPLAISISLLMSTEVFATCTNNVTQEVNISFPNISTQRDAPIGTVLATVKGDALNSNIACGVDYTYNGTLSRFMEPTSASNVYATNIPGIGIRMSAHGYVFPFSTNVKRNTQYYNTTATAELVKYGPSASGSLTTGRFASTSYGTGKIIANFNIISGTVSTASCNISNPAITVPMGNNSTDNFKAVGSTGPSNSFKIMLSCPENIDVYFRIDGNTTSSGSNILSLSSSGATSAKDIGVQLLYNGNPLAIGKDQRFGVTGSYGNYIIPLIARYYQTGSNVIAGSANSSATFTMSYK